MEILQPLIDQVAEKIVSHGPDWVWRGKRYLGAAHGDAGILTQVLLTKPELAPEMKPVVEKLLALQQPDGNWTWGEREGKKPLVQWCHGAPGIVLSLVAARKFYPELEARIDEAIKRGRELVFAQGMLKKMPCLCHGIFGNAA